MFLSLNLIVEKCILIIKINIILQKLHVPHFLLDKRKQQNADLTKCESNTILNDK